MCYFISAYLHAERSIRLTPYTRRTHLMLPLQRRAFVFQAFAFRHSASLIRGHRQFPRHEASQHKWLLVTNAFTTLSSHNISQEAERACARYQTPIGRGQRLVADNAIASRFTLTYAHARFASRRHRPDDISAQAICAIVADGCT